MSATEVIEIKPAKVGVSVPKPDGTRLKAEGEKVKRSAFWVRRLNDGDVVLLKAKTSSKAVADTTKTEGE